MKKKVTSADVAKRAGVSRTTVSYVLNKVPDVQLKEETKKKVMEAAKALGYFPNNTAQALKTNRSMSIGIVSKRKMNEYRFVSVASAIQETLRENGYNVVFCSDEQSDDYYEYYRLYKMNKIDGLIFISHQEQIVFEEMYEQIKQINVENIPAVFVDYHFDNTNLNAVDIDYRESSYAMTTSLIAKGHKRIALVIPNRLSTQEKQRISGVEKAILEDSAVNLDIIEGFVGSDLNQLCEKLLLSKKYSAVIASWVHVGLTLLYEANKAQMEIPKEIAIVALANNGFETMSYPKLSTVDLPLEKVGKIAAKQLLESLQGEYQGHIEKIDGLVFHRESS